MKHRMLSLLFVVLMILSGCNTETTPSTPNTEELLDAIDSYIQNEIHVGEPLPLMQQYQNAILNAISYRILSCDAVSESNDTMNVEFTYIDVLAMADSVSDVCFAEDEYYQACLEIIQQQECRMITEKVEIAYEVSAEGYCIVRSDPLINVLSGGVLNYYKELLEEIDHG